MRLAPAAAALLWRRSSGLGAVNSNQVLDPRHAVDGSGQLGHLALIGRRRHLSGQGDEAILSADIDLCGVQPAVEAQ